MSKRFTDTDKWKHPSFRSLTPHAKLAWLYLVDTCDHAGIWLIDFDLMSFQLGFDFTEKMLVDNFGDKLYPIGKNRILILDFLYFQYGKSFDKGSKVRDSVIKILNDFNISLDTLPPPLSKGTLTHRHGYGNTCLSATDTESESVSETDTGRGSGGGGNKSSRFDFDKLYIKFPRKEKKTLGLARCKTQIKTQKDYDDLSTAIENYISKKKGVEKQYLMQFSTFMSEWRDWLDPQTGTSTMPREKTGLEQWAELNGVAYESK